MKAACNVRCMTSSTPRGSATVSIVSLSEDRPKSMQMNESAGLTISVLVALIDSRGVLGRVREGWCSRQRYGRGRYEVVVAGHVTGEDLDAVSRHLGARDRHVGIDATNASTQWRAAAEAATGQWLVFSEAHCVPAPDFLEQIERRIRETDADVLGISSPGTSRGTLEWLDQKFVDSELEQRHGQEQAVSPRGFAMRRSTYDAAGGITPGAGPFAIPLLGKNLSKQRARFDVAPEAVLVHYNVPTIEQPKFCVADYIDGEYNWRASVSEVEAWDMFGAPPILACRGDVVPRHARAAALALVRRATRALVAPTQRRRARIMAETVQGICMLLVTMICGPRASVIKSDIAAKATEYRLRRAGRDPAGISAYRQHWYALAHAAAWHRIDRPETPPAMPDIGEKVTVESRHLFGLSPPERVGNRWLRRVRGVAGMRLPTGIEGNAIQVRFEPTAAPSDLMVFWRGRFIGMVRAAESNNPIALPPASKFDGSGAGMLVLIDDAAPLPHWRSKRSVPAGHRERANAAWVDVVVHTERGPLTFVVSPSATF
jgi:hypothetical protein